MYKLMYTLIIIWLHCLLHVKPTSIFNRQFQAKTNNIGLANLCYTASASTVSTVRSLLDCSDQCARQDDCKAFNYRGFSPKPICHMFNATPDDSFLEPAILCRAFIKKKFISETDLPKVNPIDVNLALGKPVYQSSTYDDGISSPRNVVDGNDNGLYDVGSCSSTADDVGGYNWFIVDLQGSYHVAYVIIANRMDIGAGNRLELLYVGILGYYVEGTQVTRGSYPLCGRYNYPSEGVAKVKVTCAADILPGRFVIVQQYELLMYFLVCEIEVYGDASPTI